MVKYLKKGTELGWCNYDGQVEARKTIDENGIKLGKRLSKEVEVFKDGEYLGTFRSANELSRVSLKLFNETFRVPAICRVCRNERNHYKGYVFRYI